MSQWSTGMTNFFDFFKKMDLKRCGTGIILWKVRRDLLQDQSMKQGKTTAFFQSAVIIADSFAFARISNFCRISSIII